jgi:hypothetical protein
MSAFHKYSFAIKDLAIIFAVLILARAGFVMLMPAVYSKDLYAWLNVIDILHNGQNPYRVTDVLNWPPFWMQLLFVINKISGLTGISTTHLIQCCLTLGELLAVVVAYVIMKRHFKLANARRYLLWGIALNPVSIFLSCQHCNYDVFVGLWILIFTLALLEYHRSASPVQWLIACFFLGVGILTKTVPFVLIPLLMIGVRRLDVATIFFGIVLLFAPVVIGMSVIYVLAPEGVAANVLGYRSLAGWYGISGFFVVAEATGLNVIYKAVSPLLIIGLIIYFSLRSAKQITIAAEKIVAAVLMIMLALPTFGPGYSPPYILWFLPLAIIFYALSDPGKRRWILAGYIIVAMTYTIEYAFFPSHGAFVSAIRPSAEMNTFCEFMGTRKSQVFIRLPMFCFYVWMFFVLVRELRRKIATGLRNTAV